MCNFKLEVKGRWTSRHGGGARGLRGEPGGERGRGIVAKPRTDGRERRRGVRGLQAPEMLWLVVMARRGGIWEILTDSLGRDELAEEGAEEDED